MKKLRLVIANVLFLLALQCAVKAQMPDDAFMMDKKELCLVAGYGQNTWTQYWEGTLKRDNPNIGRFTSKMTMPMVGYGISDDLNIYASLPYIHNSSDAGNMTGKKGWQDLSISAKYFLFGSTHKEFNLSGFATVGFSIPASNYVPDFLPYSIGLGSKTAQARMVFDITYNELFYLTAQTGYVARDKIKVDRSTYYSDRQYYSNEMAVPDLWDGSFRAGFDHYRIRAEIKYAFGTSTSGADIRRNDMPLPLNKMDWQTIGFHTLLWVPGIKGLGLNSTVDKVMAGRNVGRSVNWSAGIQYVFMPFKSSESRTIKTGHSSPNNL